MCVCGAPQKRMCAFFSVRVCVCASTTRLMLRTAAACCRHRSLFRSMMLANVVAVCYVIHFFFNEPKFQSVVLSAGSGHGVNVA